MSRKVFIKKLDMNKFSIIQFTFKAKSLFFTLLILLGIGTGSAMAASNAKTAQSRSGFIPKRATISVIQASSFESGCCKKWCTSVAGYDRAGNPIFVTYCCEQCPEV
jgi:hypothetical protein